MATYANDDVQDAIPEGFIKGCNHLENSHLVAQSELQDSSSGFKISAIRVVLLI